MTFGLGVPFVNTNTRGPNYRPPQRLKWYAKDITNRHKTAIPNPNYDSDRGISVVWDPEDACMYYTDEEVTNEAKDYKWLELKPDFPYFSGRCWNFYDMEKVIETVDGKDIVKYKKIPIKDITSEGKVEYRGKRFRTNMNLLVNTGMVPEGQNPVLNNRGIIWELDEPENPFIKREKYDDRLLSVSDIENVIFFLDIPTKSLKYYSGKDSIKDENKPMIKWRPYYMRDPGLGQTMGVDWYRQGVDNCYREDGSKVYLWRDPLTLTLYSLNKSPDFFDFEVYLIRLDLVQFMKPLFDVAELTKKYNFSNSLKFQTLYNFLKRFRTLYGLLMDYNDVKKLLDKINKEYAFAIHSDKFNITNLNVSSAEEYRKECEASIEKLRTIMKTLIPILKTSEKQEVLHQVNLPEVERGGAAFVLPDHDKHKLQLKDVEPVLDPYGFNEYDDILGLLKWQVVSEFPKKTDDNRWVMESTNDNFSHNDPHPRYLNRVLLRDEMQAVLNAYRMLASDDADKKVLDKNLINIQYSNDDEYHSTAEENSNYINKVQHVVKKIDYKQNRTVLFTFNVMLMQCKLERQMFLNEINADDIREEEESICKSVEWQQEKYVYGLGHQLICSDAEHSFLSMPFVRGGRGGARGGRGGGGERGGGRGGRGGRGGFRGRGEARAPRHHDDEIRNEVKSIELKLTKNIKEIGIASILKCELDKTHVWTLNKVDHYLDFRTWKVYSYHGVWMPARFKALDIMAQERYIGFKSFRRFRENEDAVKKLSKAGDALRQERYTKKVCVGYQFESHNIERSPYQVYYPPGTIVYPLTLKQAKLFGLGTNATVNTEINREDFINDAERKLEKTKDIAGYALFERIRRDARDKKIAEFHEEKRTKEKEAEMRRQRERPPPSQAPPTQAKTSTQPETSTQPAEIEPQNAEIEPQDAEIYNEDFETFLGNIVRYYSKYKTEIESVAKTLQYSLMKENIELIVVRVNSMKNPNETVSEFMRRKILEFGITDDFGFIDYFNINCYKHGLASQLTFLGGRTERNKSSKSSTFSDDKRKREMDTKNWIKNTITRDNQQHSDNENTENVWKSVQDDWELPVNVDREKWSRLMNSAEFNKYERGKMNSYGEGDHFKLFGHYYLKINLERCSQPVVSLLKAIAESLKYYVMRTGFEAKGMERKDINEFLVNGGKSLDAKKKLNEQNEENSSLIRYLIAYFTSHETYTDDFKTVLREQGDVTISDLFANIETFCGEDFNCNYEDILSIYISYITKIPIVCIEEERGIDNLDNCRYTKPDSYFQLDDGEIYILRSQTKPYQYYPLFSKSTWNMKIMLEYYYEAKVEKSSDKIVTTANKVAITGVEGAFIGREGDDPISAMVVHRQPRNSSSFFSACRDAMAAHLELPYYAIPSVYAFYTKWWHHVALLPEEILSRIRHKDKDYTSCKDKFANFLDSTNDFCIGEDELVLLHIIGIPKEACIRPEFSSEKFKYIDIFKPLFFLCHDEQEILHINPIENAHKKVAMKKIDEPVIPLLEWIVRKAEWNEGKNEFVYNEEPVAIFYDLLVCVNAAVMKKKTEETTKMRQQCHFENIFSYE